MRKRKSARGVALAIVNVVVILGAAFIVKSLAIRYQEVKPAAS